MSSMHTDQFSSRYIPTSPLSPKLPANARPLSPTPQRARHSHHRSGSRSLHMNLPKYHPANFMMQDGVSPADTPAALAQSPISPPSLVERAVPTIKLDSPRVMREKQRELIEKAKLSSKLAASPFVSKPDAPRLDPSGSPSGPVTPLALEEVRDYFAGVDINTSRPVGSPGSRHYGRDYLAASEEVKSKKTWKTTGYG